MSQLIVEPSVTASLRQRLDALRRSLEDLPAFRGGEELPAPQQRRWTLHLPRSRRSWVLAAAVSLVATGIAAPLVAGQSEEVIANLGERVFNVGSLPPIDRPPERSTVIDRNGTVVGLLTGPENRKLVQLQEVPQVLVDAFVTTEDARFYEHDGIDTRGIIRAGLSNLRGGATQGGSTITQQYVKNALLTSERSFNRKITEATWAVRLEQELTKDEILERYLNIVYLGDGNYGVGAASEYWFGAPVTEVTLPQAALLAGMIQSPESLDPVTNPVAAKAARDVVLAQMRNAGLVTAAAADAAMATELTSLVHVTPLAAPSQPLFVRAVVDVLLDDPRMGETRDERAAQLFRGGLTITTTLDSDLQATAEAAITEAVTDASTDPMAAIVSVRPGDGAVPVMALGPHGWGPCAEGDQVCTTTTVNPLMAGMGSAGRQVGSAFKPIVFAAALEQGLTTDWHTKTTSGKPLGDPACPEYAPANYNEDSAGTIDMPEALRRSNNVFAVKLGLSAGLENVSATADALGIPDVPAYCSVSLGSIEAHPIQLAAAYAAFAADGQYCTPYLISEVRDPSGEVLLTHTPTCHQAVSEETARTVTSMLEENAVRGTATRAQIGRPIAAKTGTTDDFRDAWLVGYTPQLATAVWLGHEIPKPMVGILGYANVAGGTVPAALWAAYMGPAMDGVEVLDLHTVTLERYRTCRGDTDSFAEGRQRCWVPAPPPPPPAPPVAPAPPTAPAPAPSAPPQQEPTPAPSSPEPAPSEGAGGTA